MNDEDLKKITQAVREAVKEDVREVIKDEVDTALEPVHQKLDALTGSVIQIETTLEGYADSYKINKSNIERLDNRVTEVEDKTGIIPPQEFTIQR